MSAIRKEAKLFRNNRSQAVRIPAEYAFAGNRVLISREGDRLIIEPAPEQNPFAALIAKWQKNPPLGPEDQFPDIDDELLKPEDIF